MPSTSEIPTVDFSRIAVTKSDESITEQDWLHVGNQLMEAFTDVGFCYIQNHGITPDFIQKCFDTSERFFSLPISIKKRLLRTDPTADYTGWLPTPNTPGVESKAELFDKDLPPDYKETLNMQKHLLLQPDHPIADEVPDFQDTNVELLNSLDSLLKRCLHALGQALKLDDPTTMLHMIKKLGTSENSSTLRYAFYPRIEKDALEENQLRCSEHTDFGFITLLFQNCVKGLQVFSRDGKYIDVPPQKEAILLNVGDTLERLSGGILRSAKHRVVLDDESARSDRYTVIYFPAGDDDAPLYALCGDQKRYSQRLTCGEFMRRRAIDIFDRGEGITTHTEN